MGLISRLAEETGILTVIYSSTDVHLLFFQRFIRMFAYGQVTVILALYFASLGISETKTGLFMTCTLLGDVVISFLLTLIADKLGRRKILAFGSICMFFSGVVFAHASRFWILLVAAIVGVISPSGNEIGPFRAVEESTMAHLTDLKDRSDLYAWYSLLGLVGAAIGTISSGFLVQHLRNDYGWQSLSCYRLIFVIYSVVAIFKLVASLLLSPLCELQPIAAAASGQAASSSNPGSSARARNPPESYPMTNVRKERQSDEASETDRLDMDTDEVLQEMDVYSEPRRRSKWLFWVDYFPRWSTKTQLIMLRLSLLFGLDSFGSGVATQTWISYYFTSRFEIEEGEVGSLLFITNLVSGLSALVASSISKRLGPIITMVITHLPSSLILTVLGWPSSKVIAMVFLIIRSCTASMDVGPRQAFLSSVVSKEERTSVMGAVNVVKTLSQSGGPVVMGRLSDSSLMPIGFMIAGLCKVTYDLGILASFTKTQLYNH